MKQTQSLAMWAQSLAYSGMSGALGVSEISHSDSRTFFCAEDL